MIALDDLKLYCLNITSFTIASLDWLEPILKVMPKKTDISFILDEVDAQVRKNPNGLVSKPFAYKLENYLRKFINTRGDKAKSIKGEVLDELGLTRYCCRRHFIGHIELIQFI